MDKGLMVIATAILTACFSGVRANAGIVYNVNDEFQAYELANDGSVNSTFGNFSAGYNSTLGGFTAFTNAQHTDNWFSPKIQGWASPITGVVPAVVINTDSVAVNPIGTPVPVSAQQILMHPGEFGDNAVLRYTASVAGIYSIYGKWDSLDGGSTVNYVLKTSGITTTSLFDSPASSSNFNLVTSLAFGDTIDFVVNYDGNFSADSTGLFANIAPAPEPSMMTLMALGGVGFVALMKRRRKSSVAV